MKQRGKRPMVIPEIGDKITFVPTAYLHGLGTGNNGSEESKAYKVRVRVTGTIVSINWHHRWYRVAWETEYGGTQHECFKF